MKINNYFVDIDFNKFRYVIFYEGTKLFSCSLKNPIEAIVQLIEGKKGAR